MAVMIDALGATMTLPDGDSRPPAAPQVGEAWVTAWDGDPLAVVVISAVRSGYVLAWPVTATSGRETAPCIPITLHHGPADLMVWPDAEFSMSRVLLSQSLGAAFTDKEVRLVIGALRGECDMPVPTATSPNTPEAENDLVEVCAQAWNLADIRWPIAERGIGVLSPDVLSDLGFDGPRIGDLLAVPPKRAAGLGEGRVVPTTQEIERLVAAGLPAEGLLIEPHGAEVDALLHPRFKARLEEIAARRGMSESMARTSAYSLAESLAARGKASSTPEGEALSRVDVALDQLLSE